MMEDVLGTYVIIQHRSEKENGSSVRDMPSPRSIGAKYEDQEYIKNI